MKNDHRADLILKTVQEIKGAVGPFCLFTIWDMAEVIVNNQVANGVWFIKGIYVGAFFASVIWFICTR